MALTLEDVKPCPFCGKNVGIVTWAEEEDEGLLAHCEGDEYEEGCDFYFNLPDWNNRPIEAALKQQNADLLVALKDWSDMFDWGDFSIDFSNGVTYQGIDEGQVKGGAMLKDMRKKTKQAIADAEEARKSDLHVCDVELPTKGDE